MSLEKWSQETVERAQRNIGAFRTINGKRRRVDSSGRLRNSLGYLIDETNGKTVIKFTSDVEYAVYVEEGVRGAISSPRGTERSSFRYGAKQPPVDAILEWMKAKPLRIRNAITGQFEPRHRILTRRSTNKLGETREAGQKGHTDYVRGAAFGIARNIRKHGVEAVNYMEDAVIDGIDDLDIEDFIQI